MTIRSIVIGLLCAAGLAAVTYFNDFVIKQTPFVGNYMPISVFGLLVMLVLVVNPLLRLISRRLVLRASELATVLMLCLVACYVPGRGLMHYFGTFLMMPHQHAKTTPGWRNEGVLEMTPHRMLADAWDDPSAPNTWLSGVTQGTERLSLSDIPTRIPWAIWWPALLFWLPLLLTAAVAMMCLALVVHRQWSHHERLRYPIVEFADTLLPKGRQTLADVFRTKGFWVALIAVFCIHGINYWHTWYPEQMIRVKLVFDFRGLLEVLDTFKKGGGQEILQNITLYFTPMAFAFFLAGDISFSLGVAPFVWIYAVGIFAAHGVSLGEGGFLARKIQTFLHGGAYFGIFLVLLYTGRRYYWTALKRAFFLRTRDPLARHAVWAMRLFLVGMAAFVTQLVLVGLDWQLAVVYSAGAVMIFTVVSRLVAEGGVFYLHPYTFPCVLLWGFMGDEALGPKPLLIMFIITSLLLIDPREAIMPFTAHGLKLCESNRVPLGKATAWGVVALLLAVAIALPMTLYWQYDRGANTVTDGWCQNMVPKFAWDSATKVSQDLRLRGTLAESKRISGWQRLSYLAPNRDCVLAFFIALGLVLLFTFARLRITNWPVHPVLFLVLGTWQSRRLATSFFLGWTIKTIVTKLLGGKAYQKAKPVMIGIIAGDVLGGILSMVVGAAYYLSTGQTPKTFRVLPT